MAEPKPAYAFQGPGLDRADHLRNDPAALAALWPQAQVLVIDDEGRARYRGALDTPEFLCGEQLASTPPPAASFLGLGGERGWFALPHEALAEALPEQLDLRSACALWPALELAALAQARALLYWQSRTRYCGGCGAGLQLHRGGHAARCAGCGLEFYPRTDAAIIVAVSDGRRLLLGRQSSWPEKRWSVLAGFVEPGESFEQAVAREVMEEAGVPVVSARYAASQPWPFPSALMVGFHAEGLPVAPMVGEELLEARWFTLAELQQALASGELLLSPRLSIARWLIESWMASAPSA